MHWLAHLLPTAGRPPFAARTRAHLELGVSAVDAAPFKVLVAVGDVAVRILSAVPEAPGTEAAPAAVAGEREAALKVHKCLAAARALERQHLGELFVVPLGQG